MTLQPNLSACHIVQAITSMSTTCDRLLTQTSCAGTACQVFACCPHAKFGSICPQCPMRSIFRGKQTWPVNDPIARLCTIEVDQPQGLASGHTLCIKARSHCWIGKLISQCFLSALQVHPRRQCRRHCVPCSTVPGTFPPLAVGQACRVPGASVQESILHVPKEKDM